MPAPDHPPTSRRALLQRLEGLHAAGVTQLPRAAPGELPLPSQSLPPSEPAALSRPAAPVAGASPAPNAGAIISQESSAGGGLFAEADPQPSESVSAAPTLDVLQQEVAGCTRCGELSAARQQTVFGVGDPNARLVFLGEAPGADEDRLGEPFVGRAGQLLDKIIQACTLQREEVYILNILKCRPPGNRNPTPDESANCKHFLRRQLELIAPEYVCCLGTVAAQNLLDTTTSISRLRGRVHDYRGVKVVCTYHPAYLLRNPSAKKDTWEDMKMLMRLLGVEL